MSACPRTSLFMFSVAVRSALSWYPFFSYIDIFCFLSSVIRWVHSYEFYFCPFCDIFFLSCLTGTWLRRAQEAVGESLSRKAVMCWWLRSLTVPRFVVWSAWNDWCCIWSVHNSCWAVACDSCNMGRGPWGTGLCALELSDLSGGPAGRVGDKPGWCRPQALWLGRLFVDLIF